MRALKLFILIATFCVLLNKGFSQSAYFQKPPCEIEIIKYSCLGHCYDLESSTFKTEYYKRAGVFVEGDTLGLRVVNTSNTNIYFTIFDLQPDNKIQLISPSPNEDPKACKVVAGDVLNVAGKFQVFPPYGNGKIVTILSPEPIDLRGYFDHKYVTDEKFVDIQSNLELTQNIKWIIEGKPAVAFRDCWFSIADLIVIPKDTISKKKLNTSGKARFNTINFSGFANDDRTCRQAIANPKKLYLEFPLISFIQPLQAGATRGGTPVHIAENKGFVLKGTTAAYSGVKKILVNSEQGVITSLNNQQFYWEKQVELKPGKNNFTIVAITNDGKENCEDIILNYTNTVLNSSQNKNHLLLFGANDYLNWPRLSGAVKDISDFESILLEKFQFDKDHTYKLLNSNCTKENIDSIFRLLITRLGPTDNLIVYYAGHGILDSQLNEGYWIPFEARFNRPLDYISNGEIKKYLEALKTKHTLIFADACFSGNFFKSSRGGSFEQKIEKSRSKWIVCSGRQEEVADILPGQTNSPFSYYLLQLLNKTESHLSASELMQSIKVAVSNNSQQTPIGGPVSNVGDEGGEFIFRRK